MRSCSSAGATVTALLPRTGPYPHLVTTLSSRVAGRSRRTSMTNEQAELARVLTPVAPPRVLENVYTDDEHERLFSVVKQHGPWPNIASHHFETVDELIATVTGVVPKDHG